jgi:hypothetical protein
MEGLSFGAGLRNERRRGWNRSGVFILIFSCVVVDLSEIGRPRVLVGEMVWRSLFTSSLFPEK